ncbi:MAG: hypothetical protein M1828_006879 [Chrysothrix sp. TS-e1954]|nr:MAG: hypothetical protein M1828_006879 [Chrysothrix sp. TS-e1954]
MPSAVTPSTRSGITTTQDGERHIPSSTRPDGTVRKEIRVRAGYRPPEDVDVYKNRTAESWKSRGKSGVPGAEFIGNNDNVKAKSSARKSGKPKDALDGGKQLGNVDVKTSNGEDGKADHVKEAEPVDPEAEKEKEAKKLGKKLRQAKDLQQKKEKGDSLLPEQFEKVIRINELVRQLDRLGFDAEGQKKP